MTTEVTDAYVAVVRATVTDDSGTFELLKARLEARDGQRSAQVYAALVQAALLTAAMRLLGGQYARPDVIRLVARVRAPLAGTEDDIDPRLAEHTLLALLGDQESEKKLGKRAADKTVPVLLGAMLALNGLAMDEISGFLREVRPIAENWLAGRQGQ